MHPLIGNKPAYFLFNDAGYYVLIVASLLLYFYKKNSMGAFSKAIIYRFPKPKKVNTIITIILASVESYLMARAIHYATSFNHDFGALVGTGANYYATLIVAPFLIFLISLIIFANPIKQLDMYTLIFPIYLIPVKLACFFNGCCWGIPWEHGLYNYNMDHPGKQVPVQAMEAGFALAIFIFLLFYKKKAKPGTMYPMYLILYAPARFFIELFSAAHEKVVGPFNMYHIISVVAFVIGVVAFILIGKHNEKLLLTFEKPHEQLFSRLTRNVEKKFAEEKALQEKERLERLEKAKLARAKAKAGKRK